MADALLSVRLATVTDVPAITAIYNHYIETSTCTYQIALDTEAAREAWLAARTASHPGTVAELGGEIVGWGSLSQFRPRDGYRHAVENSLYVRHDRHRLGIGAALLSDLVARARAAEHRVIIAGISAEQTASIALHRRFGFTEAGLLRQVGRKFDRWLDLAYWELVLEERSPS
jgi:L-amino acid N-acyltransferase